jgi:hypothetical protein
MRVCDRLRAAALGSDDSARFIRELMVKLYPKPTAGT